MRAAIVAAIIAALLSFSYRAWGHGEFEWIMRGDYRGKDNVHCCGPQDCDYISDADIEVRNYGYVVTYKGLEYVFNEWAKGLHVTQRPDKSPIMCRRLQDDTPRCIFVKPMGS
jgi:hypothetical protein